MGALDGLSILVPESRELDLFAGMLEAEGAAAVRCPLVRITDLEDTASALTWITGAIAAPFDCTVLLTGEGLRKLLALAGARQQDLITALQKSKLVVRGPKPVRALREVDMTPTLIAATPTSQGVLETLAAENPTGRRIGVQLYPGDGAQPLVTALREMGAQVFPVTPYRYAGETESAQVSAVIRDMAAGKFGLVAFTASTQIERLFTVAKESGLTAALQAGLQNTPIAAVGPVMEQALAAHGLKSVVQPQASFHLKPLVRAIMAWRAG